MEEFLPLILVGGPVLVALWLVGFFLKVGDYYSTAKFAGYSRGWLFLRGLLAFVGGLIFFLWWVALLFIDFMDAVEGAIRLWLSKPVGGKK